MGKKRFTWVQTLSPGAYGVDSRLPEVGPYLRDAHMCTGMVRWHRKYVYVVSGTVRASYLCFCEHVDGRCLEHHGPFPDLVALSRHDVRQKVVDVLLNKSQLKDLLRDSLHVNSNRCVVYVCRAPARQTSKGKTYVASKTTHTIQVVLCAQPERSQQLFL